MPNPQVGGPPRAGCPQLFNIFAATLHIWRPSPPFATWGRAMPWWQGAHAPQKHRLTFSELHRVILQRNSLFPFLCLKTETELAYWTLFSYFLSRQWAASSENSLAINFKYSTTVPFQILTYALFIRTIHDHLPTHSTRSNLYSVSNGIKLRISHSIHEDLTAMNIKITIFWDVTPCSLRGSCYRVWGTYQTTRRCI
jgi:hypothetical protein